MQNKEWLFSGVGLAALVLVLRSLKSISRAPILLRRGGPEGEPITSAAATQVTTEPFNRQPNPQAAPSGSFPALSLRDVVEAIERAPLLQREAVAQQYIGVRVAWDCELSSAYFLSDGLVELNLLVPGVFYTLITCIVCSSDYPGLGLLKSRARLHLNGTIAHASTGRVTLDNVNLIIQTVDGSSDAARPTSA